MDLLDILEVNRERLPKKSTSAVAYGERRWEEKGKPTDRKTLAEFLDDLLRFCAGVGLHYPRVFLLRLKQLQRREWSPGGVGSDDRAQAGRE